LACHQKRAAAAAAQQQQQQRHEEYGIIFRDLHHLILTSFGFVQPSRAGSHLHGMGASGA